MSESKTLEYDELWTPPPDGTPEFTVANIARGTYGGAQLIDQAQIDAQKGVLSYLLKTLGSNVIEGKSIVNISLPVTIFEARSFLERMTDVWSYAPLYLTKAAKAEDPLERFKLVITWFVAGMHCGTTQLKPFNPILGETFQASYEDGSQMFLEQVSHHPPISAFQVFGPNDAWRYHGYHRYEASFRPNGILGGQVGPNNIDFPDGTRILFNLPQVALSGMVYGDRVLNYKGDIVFLDRKNKLKCEFTLNPDALSGLSSWIRTAKSPSDTLRGVLYSNNAKVCDVTGSWLDELKFGSDQYWRRGEFRTFKPIPVSDDVALPSDVRFRTDRAAIASGDLDRAQSEKERLEVIQRTDRKLRAAVANVSTPSSPTSL